MMDDLYIKWETGKMVIHLNNFFPTSQARLKKLVKIIRLDWQHCDELIEKLKVYFQDKIPESETDFQTYGKKYMDFKQRVADTGRMVDSRKRPDGVPLSKDELKAEKDRLKDYRGWERDYLQKAKKAQRAKKQYLEHLEYLKSI
nr:MAG: minor capsid protein 2 [Bacteriophage sp.]